MSHLQYFAYPGFGEQAQEKMHYSQATRVPAGGDKIEISGQPGFDPLTQIFPASFSEEVDLAFANVERTLRAAGGKGLEQVYKLNMYLAPMDDASVEVVVAALRKSFPNHKPLVTCVGVAKLALEGMRVEIEALAHLG